MTVTDTCRPQELQYLKNNEHDGPKSSEMEEPSVGQLDTDYTNLAPEYLGELDQTQVIHTGEVDNGHLPPTLEVRRKKKKSNAAVQDENTPSSRPASFITPTGSDYTRKSGSKRKFDPEEDDKYVTASVSSDDGFEFSRSSQVPHKASDNIISEHEVDSPSKKQMNGRRGPRNREQPKRKVLEPSMNSAPSRNTHGS